MATAKDPAVRLLAKIVAELRDPMKGDSSPYARGYRNALAHVLAQFKSAS